MRLLLCLVIAACTHPSVKAPAGRSELEGKIDSIVADVQREMPFAGATIGVVDHGRVVLVKAYGTADLENELPARDDTVYRIGSITKEFTAAAVMQLVEQGKLGLDDDITKYVAIDTHGKPIAIRDLLGHVSGIADFTETEGFGAWTRIDRTPADMVAHVADKPLDFDPRTKWRYSNTNYVLLGMVIEKVTGQSYGAYLAAHVWPAAGLSPATVYCDNARILPRRARGYEPGEGGKLVNAAPLSMTVPFAAGALCSTVPDLLAWSSALAGGKVVSSKSYTAMTTPVTLADGSSGPYGFGIQLVPFEGHRRVHHNGGINGFVSELDSYPDDGVTIAVLTNTGAPTASVLQGRIARMILKIPSKAVPLSADERTAVVGTYDVPGHGPATIEARATGELQLSAAGQPDVALEYRGGDEFAVSDFGVVVRFIRDAGKVTGFVLENGGTKMFEASRRPN